MGTQHIQLLDGRWLSYAEYGDPEGRPILFFHGTPSSRILRHPDDEWTASLGVRLITVDRPGFGLSEPQPRRRLLDWPDDVEALTDALDLEQFAVAGISGGGPYVSACAYKLPKRITRAGIISGVGPTDVQGLTRGLYAERRVGVWVARHAPWLLHPLVWLVQNPRRDIDRYFQKVYDKSAPADQEILDRPEIASLFKEAWLEGTRQGLTGFVSDGAIFSQPWGFDLGAVQVDVHMWHGEADTSTPLVMAQHIAAQIPNCELTTYPGKGHFFLFEHWGDILRALIDRPSRP